jgi:hypothetical protein
MNFKEMQYERDGEASVAKGHNWEYERLGSLSSLQRDDNGSTLCEINKFIYKCEMLSGNIVKVNRDIDGIDAVEIK